MSRPPYIHTARSYFPTHVWAVYHQSYDERRYVHAESDIDAAEEGAGWFDCQIHQIIVRYYLTTARWWAPWRCADLNGEKNP